MLQRRARDTPNSVDIRQSALADDRPSTHLSGESSCRAVVMSSNLTPRDLYVEGSLVILVLADLYEQGDRTAERDSAQTAPDHAVNSSTSRKGASDNNVDQPLEDDGLRDDWSAFAFIWPAILDLSCEDAVNSDVPNVTQTVT
jgi:hypothetical protein